MSLSESIYMILSAQDIYSMQYIQENLDIPKILFITFLTSRICIFLKIPHKSTKEFISEFNLNISSKIQDSLKFSYYIKLEGQQAVKTLLFSPQKCLNFQGQSSFIFLSFECKQNDLSIKSGIFCIYLPPFILQYEGQLSRKGVPVNPLQSKLKITSIEFVHLLLS
ncbi:hypothetical protein IMG5_060500 [Ichthyophthirius multifiliis]|uniref:Uncharacterized protein n=1 Tax=Ichthyophthirius multifiliis TaxID=5932 RepID=G0QNN8_ICHMU|nr:hypothetical protein IMG5_060500 [Ichthyophthirius multifiliis]EGR33157.1 hypothetical protein IMG5_060500 [Ichthyophthirius multifiliis]|eukprot:XP_004037143.1 hypothetical protein IMG5_060500 [Ichthyophthirius multifiliis]